MVKAQFSLRNMLIMVGYFALSCGLGRWAVVPGNRLVGLCALLAVACVGAGVGAIFNRQAMGMAIATIVALGLPCVGLLLMALL